MQYNRKAYFSLNEINSFPWKGMKEVSAGRSQLSLHELTFNLDSPQAHDCPQSWILGEWDLSSISQLLGLPMCNLRLVWFKESEYSNAVSHPFTVTPLRAKLKKTNSTWFRKVPWSLGNVTWRICLRSKPENLNSVEIYKHTLSHKLATHLAFSLSRKEAFLLDQGPSRSL